jgi:hypothetical protein
MSVYYFVKSKKNHYNPKNQRIILKNVSNAHHCLFQAAMGW